MRYGDDVWRSSFLASFIDSLCRVRNKIMYVLLWRTVYALTRVLLCNSGNKHQKTLSWAHKQFATRVNTLFLFDCMLTCVPQWIHHMSQIGVLFSSYTMKFWHDGLPSYHEVESIRNIYCMLARCVLINITRMQLKIKAVIHWSFSLISAIIIHNLMQCISFWINEDLETLCLKQLQKHV